MKTTTPPILIILSLVCFGLLPMAQAVTPAPDGGYANFNTAEGTDALFHLTSGQFNTALGGQALFSDTIGTFNTATGVNALFHNNGSFNTANGGNALLTNTSGTSNTATGVNALYSNNGSFNTANGVNALVANTSGSDNTATGEAALFSNTQGNFNTATGFQALNDNGGGNDNTAMGFQALLHNTTGDNNIALGAFAGLAINAGDFNIDIGNLGDSGDSSTIRIGDINQARTFIAGISGVAVSGTTVVVNGFGQLGVAGSSARFKNDIKPMDKASEAILALEPVTFRYKKDIDPQGLSQFGLVAEDVEKVNPDLVVHDKEGKPYSVRYDQVNAMLLNEFLKEHRTVQELKSVVAKQEAAAAQLQKQIEALTAGLQKVSAQLEASKPAPQVVNNP
jgi:trimeric autotransporter adhesin